GGRPPQRTGRRDAGTMPKPVHGDRRKAAAGVRVAARVRDGHGFLSRAAAPRPASGANRRRGGVKRLADTPGGHAIMVATTTPREEMMSRPLHSSTAALALTLCWAAAPALAETVTFKDVTLAAGSEVPPNDSAGTGTVKVTYDTATKKLSWEGTFSGLT